MSIRGKLTLWYAVVLALVLVLYAAVAYLFLDHRLSAALDRRLHADFEAAEQALSDGEHPHDEPDPRWVEARTEGGALLYRAGPEPGLDASLARGEPLRVHRGRYLKDGEIVFIRVARSEAGLRHELGEFAFGMGIALPFAVALLAAAGWFLARRTLAPVDRLVAQARSITAERLGDRLPVENPHDELGRLAAAFNEAFSRLQASFDEMRRFTADAAHELRTPLTVLRTVGEVGLRDDAAAHRDTIASMLEETDRMAGLVDALLALARADAGAAVTEERVDLAAFARDTAAHVAPLAEERGQTIEVEADAAPVVDADPDLLRQALRNLLDNAIRYGPRGGAIRVRVFDAGIEVRDEGPGIAPEHHARIFDRFYRADEARARDSGGAGLGLAIARWAVAAQGGHIEVESAPGAGATFRITLTSPRR